MRILGGTTNLVDKYFPYTPFSQNNTHKRTADAKHNGNGFVGYDPDLDVVIVSFAGTDTGSTKNWIDDLDGELTHYPWAGEEEGMRVCFLGGTCPLVRIERNEAQVDQFETRLHAILSLRVEEGGVASAAGSIMDWRPRPALLAAIAWRGIGYTS